MHESTAAHHVLGTPELLELVISSLPPLEILVLQRVARAWRGVVSSSPEIQRMLFFRPDWNLEARKFDAWRPENRPGERPKNNRMLRRVLDGQYPTVTLRITNDGDDDADDSGVEMPDSTFDLPARREKEQRPSGHWSWDVNITYPADRVPSSDPAVLYEGASWRKMFICQPPCKELHLMRRWQKSSKPVIECEEGITMEIFMDKALKAKQSWNEAFIASDRDWHFEGPIQCSSVAE